MAAWSALAVTFAFLSATAPGDVEPDPAGGSPEATGATQPGDVGVLPEPVVAEPEPEPDPEPMTADTSAPPPIAASAGTNSNGAGAPREDPAPPPDDSPVVRSVAGDWGMQFTFGGLAPMSIAGINDFTVNRLLFSELGVRRILQNGWIIPFSIGAGVFHHNPESGGSQNDAGISATVGVRKRFRVWRRIAPYAGADFRLTYLDPTGDNNWLFGMGIGPNLGIEFFIGDRVSLLMQGDVTLGINVFDGLLQVGVGSQVSAGGQMGLVFYF